MLLLLAGHFKYLKAIYQIEDYSLTLIREELADATTAKNAGIILSLKKSGGNFLLVALHFLETAACTGFITVCVYKLGEIWGFIIAGGAVFLFGTIVFSAWYSRFPLGMGAFMKWPILFFMTITSPVSWPLGKLYDKAVGGRLGLVFDEQQVEKLFDKTNRADHNVFSMMLHMSGIAKKPAAKYMTPIHKCFQVMITEPLDFEMMRKIYKTRLSRFLVVDKNKPEHDNVKGCLFTKDLILLDPYADIKMETVYGFYGQYLPRVDETDPIIKVVAVFNEYHMDVALVMGKIDDPNGGDPIPKVVGMVTVEDIFEGLNASKDLHATRAAPIEMCIQASGARLTEDEATAIYLHLSNVPGLRKYCNIISVDGRAGGRKGGGGGGIIIIIIIIIFLS